MDRFQCNTVKELRDLIRAMIQASKDDVKDGEEKEMMSLEELYETLDEVPSRYIAPTNVVDDYKEFYLWDDIHDLF